MMLNSRVVKNNFIHLLDAARRRKKGLTSVCYQDQHSVKFFLLWIVDLYIHQNKLKCSTINKKNTI